MSKEGRRSRRLPYTGPVQVSWEERGETRFARGRCIDVGESGLRIELPVGIAQATEIRLNAERVRISGSARVRHTERYGSKYLIGVELSQALQAKALEALNDPRNLRAPGLV